MGTRQIIDSAYALFDYFCSLIKKKTLVKMKRNFTLLLMTLIIGTTPLMVAAQNESTELTNLVIFLRFADDPEITHPFAPIDTMFNGKTPGYLSIYNFYKALTYDKIHYNTVYTNNIHNGQIISFQDSHPRGYYEPYSATNPIGYQGDNPFIGISRREAELLAAAFDYVDENHLVDDDVVLDGDGDGDIDNVSFIVIHEVFQNTLYFVICR